MSTDMLAAALGDAATRHGAMVRIATGVAQALARPEGVALVALSRREDGMVEMTRGPLPHEGGALHVHMVDDAGGGGAMPPDTAAWIEEWAFGLALIERHGQALRSAGAEPADLPPWGVCIDAAARCMVAAAGHDPAALLASAGWRRSDTGYTTRITTDTIEADVDRYLDVVRFSAVRVMRTTGDLRYEELDGEAHLSLDLERALPETLVMAAAGKPLSCLMSSDAAPPPDNEITTTRQDGRTLHVTARTTHHRMAVPSKEKKA